MKKRGQIRYVLVALLFLFATACFILTGCSKNKEDPPPEHVLQSIEVIGAIPSFEEGDTLTLAKLTGVKVVATYSDGETEEFVLSTLESLPTGMTIDKLGTALNADTVVATVVYTVGVVEKQATFSIVVNAAQTLPEGTLVIDEIPGGTIKISATAKDLTARANVSFEYGETALILTAYVEDAVVFTSGSNIYANDGIEILIDKVVRQKGYSDNTLSVVADAKGNVVVKNLKTDESISDSGISSRADLISLDGSTVAGYKLVVELPYSACGLDKSDFNAAVCVGLNNAYNGNIASFKYSDAFGEDYENVYTFAHIEENGTVSENMFVNYGFIWGDAGNFKASSVWNTDGDDGETNHIYMTGNDYSDNYVYMMNSGKLDFYAEISVKVSEVMPMANGAYDGYPKFGLLIKNTSGNNGFIYYVDAVSDAATGTINANAVNLGYNTLNANGWEGNWSNIGVLGANSSAYTEDYLTLGIYRQGGVFVFYCNGNVVKTATTSVATDEIAYLGLFSFNLKLDVNDYKLLTEENDLAPYVVNAKDLDYLFIGSSYISTAFWYNWGDAFGEYSAENIGVPGSRISLLNQQLDTLKITYNPANIIVYIGGNDINDGNLSGEETFNLLRDMFESYHQAFPNATIHYATVVRSMLFKDKWAQDADYYNRVIAYAQSRDWVKIVDTYAAVVPDANGSTQHWFGADGLHFGVDGYALLTKLVYESLGLDRPSDLGFSGLGDLDYNDAPAFVYSPGWTEDNGVVYNAGISYNRIGAESQVFIRGLYATDFYAEVKISVGDCNAYGDAWAKTGLAIRTESGTYYYFINCGTATNGGKTADGHTIYTDKYGNVMYRPETIDRGWSSPLVNQYFSLGSVSYDHYTDNSFTTLGVVKYGDTLALYANGVMVCYLDGMTFGENEKAAVSVFTFNMEVFAKDAVYTTDAVAIANYLPKNAVIDGNITDGIWTAEVLSNTLSFGEKSDGRHLELAAVKGEDGVYFALTVYAYANTRSDDRWFVNSNVEFRFGNNLGTQYYAYVCGAGYNRAAGSANNMFVSIGSSELYQGEGTGAVYKTVFEMFAPYSEFSGFTASDEEIRVYVWGYVFDEGWSNIMNVGSWPVLSVSDKGLRFMRSVSADVSNAEITLSQTVAGVGDVITVEVIEVAAGYRLDKLYYNGTELVQENGAYSFVMPDENVVITATFLGARSVDMSAVAGKLTVSNAAPFEGTEVEFTATENTFIVAIYVDGVELEPDANGKYLLVVQNDVVITGEFLFTIDGIILDGNLDALYGNTNAKAYYDNNRDITVYGVQTENGVFLHVVAYMNTTKTDSSAWYNNTNFEFYLNAASGKEQRHVNIAGDTSGVSEYVWKTELLAADENGHMANQYKYTVELFVHKNLIADWNTDGVQFNYAWKTEGEGGFVAGDTITGWALGSTWGGDWLGQHTGGVDIGAGDVLTGLGTYGNYSKKVKITSNGIKVGAEAAYADIDGNLSDELYNGIPEIEKSDASKTVKAKAITTDDGLYFAIEITHNGWSPKSNENWAQNDNVEIHINGAATVVILGDGYTYIPDFFSKGAAITVESDGKLITTLELFAAGRYSDNYRLFMGVAGSSSGFNGWLEVANAYITPQGITATAPAVPATITLNGEFTESVWTEEVKGNAFSQVERGARITVIGVSAENGILLGFTVEHNKPTDAVIQSDGSAWWNYMGPEFRLARMGTQFAVTAWNNTAIGACSFGHKTIDNGEGAEYRYTTTFEVYVQSYELQCRDVEKCAFYMGGVYETGFSWLFNGDKTAFYITSSGLVKAY